MTLSNFDWTDKDSVKWFILLPTGHEGPYSLSALISMKAKNKISSEVKVWAEGLSETVFLSELIDYGVEEIPELPPLPTVEEDIPPIPMMEPTPPKTRKLWPYLLFVSLFLLSFVGNELIKRLEHFNIRRYPKMSLELHERIQKEFSFDGWGKKIFFREYLPSDQSHIWLITSSYQTCKIEASFESLDNKVLSMKEEKVAFKTQGVLKEHVVEFSSFDFQQGNKIIPGLYEMDIKASDCKWDGLVPSLMNAFRSPDQSYSAQTKVVLFSKGPVEFNKILDRLIEKKMAIELKEKNRMESFWLDLQQKMETLQAITFQIEQLILELVQSGPSRFQKGLRPMVSEYTKKFGAFLTNFVIENEKYFGTLELPGLADHSQKKDYELMVRLTSKKIGFESMKFIEEFQAMKTKPKTKELNEISERVKKTYSLIKNDINQKIIQVSEDRSK